MHAEAAPSVLWRLSRRALTALSAGQNMPRTGCQICPARRHVGTCNERRCLSVRVAGTRRLQPWLQAPHIGSPAAARRRVLLQLLCQPLEVCACRTQDCHGENTVPRLFNECQILNSSAYARTPSIAEVACMRPAASIQFCPTSWGDATLWDSEPHRACGDRDA